jgi:hypothetical protein
MLRKEQPYYGDKHSNDYAEMITQMTKSFSLFPICKSTESSWTSFHYYHASASLSHLFFSEATRDQGNRIRRTAHA